MDTVFDTNKTDSGKKQGKHHAVVVGDESFNFTCVEFHDLHITGAEIAMAAGKHPVEDFVVLQHLASGELESLRPTEVADLGAPSIQRFFVIKGATSYRFDVEGLSLEWPLSTLTAAQIKFLAGGKEGQELVLQRFGVDEVLDDQDQVDISGEGVEHFRLRHRKMTVTVTYGGDTQFELERRSYTTEELIIEFGVPSGYELDFISPDGVFRAMTQGEHLRVREGMEFASHPPTGQSS